MPRFWSLTLADLKINVVAGLRLIKTEDKQFLKISLRLSFLIGGIDLRITQ